MFVICNLEVKCVVLCALFILKQIFLCLYIGYQELDTSNLNKLKEALNKSPLAKNHKLLFSNKVCGYI